MTRPASTPPLDWRSLPASEMEQHFNPRAVNPDAQRLIDDFSARSAQARERIPGRYDIRYGERPKETLDLHVPEGAEPGLPLVVFIHGGFWRALDKSDHSFVAPSLLDTGAIVANVNYDLCPTVTLDEIVDEIANAVRFCRDHAASWGADPDGLYLFGHSAGAHLAARMLQREWSAEEFPAHAIRGVAAISGVYEPEVILGITVNEEAQITPDSAARQNCFGREFTLKPRMLVAVGGDEPEGWSAQSAAFADACREDSLSTDYEVVAGANHFSVLNRALTRGDPLHEAVVSLWR
ncbi:MAG: alpha/beta hydrolase [Gammaproteobacteria bacterium]